MNARSSWLLDKVIETSTNCKASLLTASRSVCVFSICSNEILESEIILFQSLNICSNRQPVEFPIDLRACTSLPVSVTEAQISHCRTFLSHHHLNILSPSPLKACKSCVVEQYSSLSHKISDILAESDPTKAETLINSSSKVCSMVIINETCHHHTTNISTMGAVQLIEESVIQLIMVLRSIKTVSPDGLYPRLLSSLARDYLRTTHDTVQNNTFCGVMN